MIIEWDDFWLKCIAILVSGFIHFRRLIYVTRYLKLNIIRGESNFDVEHVLRLSLSKYSNENTEGQREEGFHVNSNWTWVKSKHSLSYTKLRLRVLIGSGWLSQQARAKYRVKKKASLMDARGRTSYELFTRYRQTSIVAYEKRIGRFEGAETMSCGLFRGILFLLLIQSEEWYS